MEISKAIEQIQKLKRRYWLEPDMQVALNMAIRAFAAVSEASTYLDFVEKKPQNGDNTLEHYKFNKMLIKEDKNNEKYQKRIDART